MKKTLLLTVMLCFVATTLWAAKTTYVVTNHRFNYVKIKEVSSKEASSKQITQPVTLDEQGLKNALASLSLSRAYLIKKEVDTLQIFDESAINFLAPALVKAFSEAQSNDIIVVSYLTKNPIFILRNDRINICQMWISNGELHVKFEKLYAKIIGDIDKRGNEAKAIGSAVSLRVKLEIGPGQKMGVDDDSEVVLDLDYNYAKKPAEEQPKVIQNVTMSGEKIETPVPTAEDTTNTAKDKAKKEKGKLSKVAKEEVTPTPVPAVMTPKDRLQQLEDLKKQGLINKKEYDEKRKEIVKDL